ncbi:MAG: hypothetical protein HUU08_12905 [Candidatus Brocadia sp.]|nr:hypothetical protein [Candidatus Brocadia sp.]
MKLHLAVIGALGVTFFLIGCQPPVLNSIQPNQGVTKQIIGVEGSNLLFASVRWDADLLTETDVLQSFLTARYFQVPEADIGNHPVRLRNNAGYSADTKDFILSALSGNWPPPRSEDIGITLFSDNGDGTADIWLAVPVANVDPDATVQVDGAEKPSIFTSAIPNDYFSAHTASTYGYPVYHYGLLVSFLDNQALGENLSVRVTNTDGNSTTRTYQLPAAATDLDSDNDGLLDTWEAGGYLAPSGAIIDLAAMGCDSHRKDILVEVDWIAAAVPNDTIWTAIEDVFANAPILNPDGSQGISIHIDRGQGGAFTNGGTTLADHQTMDFGPNANPGYTDFFTYKGNATNFNPDRLNIFHYGVFGRARPGGSSGRGEIWGNDFMVTFVTFGEWGADITEAGTFIHELGHNLGLRHGGIDNAAADANETFKPNQESTMNYRYQFGGVSNDCNFTSEDFHTYSQGMYASINEADVNENIGICDNSPIDFDNSGVLTNGAAVNTNESVLDADTTDVHVNYDEWGNLKLNFTAPGSRWNGN